MTINCNINIRVLLKNLSDRKYSFELSKEEDEFVFIEKEDNFKEDG